MNKALKIVFYSQIGLLLAILTYLVMTQFSLLQIIVPVIVVALAYLIFGGPENFQKWVQERLSSLQTFIFKSTRRILLLNILLLVLIITTGKGALNVYSQNKQIAQMQDYKNALVTLAETNPELRIIAARTISELFTDSENPTDFAIGLLTICGDANPKVRHYCEQSISNSHFRNQQFTLQFEEMIFDALRTLRQEYCKPLDPFDPDELIQVSTRLHNLLLTFTQVSRFIKSPEYKSGLGRQDGICHEIVYESLDLLALLINSHSYKRSLTSEEAFQLAVIVNEIKQLLRAEPFSERYRFITSPEAQIDPLRKELPEVQHLPTWFLFVKYRMRQFIPKEQIDSVLTDVLTEPFATK